MADKELQQKVDHSALILEMTTALSQASDRWSEVCRVYSEAWDTAVDTHVEVLKKINSAKEARAKAAADRVKLCFDLAAVFLPMIGGPAAISMAPILSARAQLLVNTVEKRALQTWSTFSTSRPIVAKVVAEAGKRSANEGKDIASKIQKQIMEKIAPAYANPKVPPANTKPITAFTDSINRTRDYMNTWVADCAKWNAAGSKERIMIPVAHDLFLNHPWIRTAPQVETTQGLRSSFSTYIEMVLWLRWARTLNEQYWQKAHDWYDKEYWPANRNDKVQMVKNRARALVIDILDYRPLFLHFAYNFPRHLGVVKWTILNPRDMFPGEDVSLDLYALLKTAKHRSAPLHMLGSIMPPHTINQDFARELMAF